jgi:IrrE N-terminal-like domain
VSGTDSDEKPLDECLSELAAGIFTRIEPGDLRQSLSPPSLLVSKDRSHGLNSYCVGFTHGTKRIVIGGGVYPFFQLYVQAAAAYFLPHEEGGLRPSASWEVAKSALATALDWTCVPLSPPVGHSFPLGAKQTQAARAFGAFTYRFVLCHEMAHVALEHVGIEPSEPSPAGQQEREQQADRLALDLQIKTVPRHQLVTALASSIYFVHVTGLLNARLMLLGPLVDHNCWTIEYSHPPTLLRIVNLMRQANALVADGGAALQKVHDSLTPIDSEVIEKAIQQQNEVIDLTLSFVGSEVVRYEELLGSDVLADGAQTKKCEALGAPSDEKAKQIMALLEKSPTGVLVALESRVSQDSGNSGKGQEHCEFLVKEQLASVLPTELQDFRRQTRQERAKQMA